MRVYDDFPIGPGSPELQSGGFGVSRFALLAVAGSFSIREKNENEPATLPLLGYLNSRNANNNDVFSADGTGGEGTGLPEIRGRFACDQRLEPAPPYLLQARDGETGQGPGAGTTVSAATATAIAGAAACGGNRRSVSRADISRRGLAHQESWYRWALVRGHGQWRDGWRRELSGKGTVQDQRGQLCQ